MQASSEFIIGIDIGQLHDFSAVTVVERTNPKTGPALYDVRHVDRFRSIPYPTAVDRIRTLYETTELYGRSTWVLDATGVGRGVLDIIDAAGIKAAVCPITITAGEEVTTVGREKRVPKSHLVFTVQNLLSTRRLRLSSHVAEVPLLVQELAGFKVRYGPSGRETYGNDARETPFDDLVLSLSLAVWWGEKARSGFFDFVRDEIERLEGEDDEGPDLPAPGVSVFDVIARHRIGR